MAQTATPDFNKTRGQTATFNFENDGCTQQQSYLLRSSLDIGLSLVFIRIILLRSRTCPASGKVFVFGAAVWDPGTEVWLRLVLCAFDHVVDLQPIRKSALCQTPTSRAKPPRAPLATTAALRGRCRALTVRPSSDEFYQQFCQHNLGSVINPWLSIIAY